MKHIFSWLFKNKDKRNSVAAEIVLKPSNISEDESYYGNMVLLQDAISGRRYHEAARLVRANLKQVPDLIKKERKEYGKFDLSIPALDQGGIILALIGDDEGLEEMAVMAARIPDLSKYINVVSQHKNERILFRKIYETIEAHPGCLQSEVKVLLGEPNGHLIANLISYLEKANKIVRKKEGRSYKLYIPGVQIDAVSKLLPKPKSHRTNEKAIKYQEIEIKSLKYTPLPRSAPTNLADQPEYEKKSVPQAEDHFEIEGKEWRISSIEEIPSAERPDPAFRKMFPCDSGLIMVDDLGNASGFEQYAAAAIRYDREGNLAAKAGLEYGTRGISVHPCGRSMIAMSKDGILHAYDENLKLQFKTLLFDAPEIKEIKRSREIRDDQLKNHIRCVAMSLDSTRYLYTVVDEAYCIGANGDGLWGVKLPKPEGWKEVSSPSSRYGTSDELRDALKVMNLAFPITSETIKRQYRELARKWHPDMNPGDKQSEEKMKDINAAAELLTGIDPVSLLDYTQSTFIQEYSRNEYKIGNVTITTSIGFQTTETPADWIYAAGFSANNNSIYLAGYSGRIILVNDKGSGVRIYDIGGVPHKIVDTGDYLYILTYDRLYVLQNDALFAIVDTIGRGDLIVAQTGFGLLEKSRLRWFSENGTYLGCFLSKDPIRRVYSKLGKTVVETRQRRAFITGIPEWWG